MTDKQEGPPATPDRQSLIQTNQGITFEAFGVREWSLVATAALIWGSSFLFIDIALDDVAPGVIPFVRILFGAAALALLPATRRPIDRRDWGRIGLLAVIWMAFPLTLFSIAQQWINSSLAGMLNAGMPLFSAAFAAVLLRRLPGTMQLLGLSIGFAGVFLIGVPGVSASGTSAAGVVMVIVAVAGYGLAVNIAVPLQQAYGALAVIARVQWVALVLTVPYALIDLPQSTATVPAVAALVALGALGTGAAFAAMAALVGRVGATRGSLTIYFIPIIAIALGVVFRNDLVTNSALIGTPLVLLGAWLTSRADAPRTPE